MLGETLSVTINLDRVSPEPLYLQLAQQLKRAVIDGKLPKGAMLQSEVVLAEDWEVSRPTVRRAIQELVDDGMLVRKRGVGTQVVNEDVKRGFALTSLYDDLIEGGKSPSTQVIELNIVPAPESVAIDLDLPADAPVGRMLRVRYASDEPLAFMTNWMRAEIAEQLEIAKLEAQGFYELLRQLGYRPHSATQRVGATLADAEVARHLDVEPGAALVTMNRVMQDDQGLPLEVGDHRYDADRYSIEVSVVV